MRNSEQVRLSATRSLSADTTALLLANAPASLWVTDAQLRILTVQGGILSNDDAAGLLGRSIPEIYLPRGMTELVAAHEGALHGDSGEYELQWRGRTHVARVDPLRLEDGTIDGVVGVAVDVSTHRTRESQRELTAAVGEVVVRGGQLNELLEHCALAAARVLHLPVVRIWLTSPRNEHLTLEAWAGEFPAPDRTRVAFGDGAAGRTASAGRPIVGAPVADVASGSELEWARGEGLRVFHGIPLRIGERLLGVLTAWARETTGEDVGTALRAMSDELALAIDRDRAHKALTESEARYRQLFERFPIPLIAYDPRSLTILDGNAATASSFGYAPEALVGHQVSELFAAAPDRRTRSWLRARTPTLKPRTFLFRAVDGRTHDVEVFLRDAVLDGRPVRIATLFHLSDRLQAERLQREMLSRVIEAQEQERRHIARELHDHVGQHLAAQTLMVRALMQEVRGANARERLTELKRSTDIVSRELQELSFLLRPAALDDFGIAGALDVLTRQWSAHHGIPTRLAVRGLDGVVVEASVETAIYRIVQEALTNVAKHANASRVTVSLTHSDGRLSMMIGDDGQGVGGATRSRAPNAPGGFGLRSMKDRTEAIGGHLAVEARRGQGTVIRLAVPLSSRGT